MSLTTTGLVLLTLALGLFPKGSRPLLFLAAFLSHFGATSIIDMPEFMGGRGVAPWVVCGGLAAVRLTSDAVRGRLQVRPSLTTIGALVMAVAVLAALAGGAAVVTYGKTFTDTDRDSPGQTIVRDGGLDARQVTQAAYWLLGAVMVGAGGLVLRTEEHVERLIMAFAWGAAFSAGWGFSQWLAEWAGFDWPWWIFNQSPSPYAQGWRQLAGLDRFRGLAGLRRSRRFSRPVS